MNGRVSSQPYIRRDPDQPSTTVMPNDGEPWPIDLEGLRALSGSSDPEADSICHPGHGHIERSPYLRRGEAVIGRTPYRLNRTVGAIPAVGARRAPERRHCALGRRREP